ncbi:leucyl aminopeptidase family protein [Mangrovihabitans endophyticus]|uniref:leucyl aminopeptidase family protein n=1 Tax=Mangrovihabitans endophyticus TaxID=1751298 RepID=UPI001E48DC92|nr:leucyl aminopeptidase family protein [Mangrovihabitans endophyticus]
MFAIRLTDARNSADASARVVPAGADGPLVADERVAAHCEARGTPQAGAVRELWHPDGPVLVVGVGAQTLGEWRAAGAVAVRAMTGDGPLRVLLPAAVPDDAMRALVEGLWLGGYHVRTPRTEAVDVQLTGAPTDGAEARLRAAIEQARAVASAVWFARDLTNAPASEKNPAWFADQVVDAASGRVDLSVTVRDEQRLAAEGFGALLAVGGGSATPPRLVEMSYRPPAARQHIVLVGKGITFDTGGISIKTREGMKLMKKDMAGAAAVVAATLAAADLRLPVRVTTLAPLAENAVSGSAYRPGDVIEHYDGTTTETTNSDAEGRLVLADALGYAVRDLRPDVVVDLATLTGANAVALGRRTAALYSHNDDLAAALVSAGEMAGEAMWQLPLPDDYTDLLRSDLADRHSSPAGGPGSVVAALFLREFLGDRVGDWAHLDMSAPSWSDSADGVLSKGATGWGAHMLVRWLERQGEAG